MAIREKEHDRIYPFEFVSFSFSSFFVFLTHFKSSPHSFYIIDHGLVATAESMISKSNCSCAKSHIISSVPQRETTAPFKTRAGVTSLCSSATKPPVVPRQPSRCGRAPQGQTAHRRACRVPQILSQEYALRSGMSHAARLLRRYTIHHGINWLTLLPNYVSFRYNNRFKVGSKLLKHLAVRGIR